jgi:coproporphyrinogen III oxidase
MNKEHISKEMRALQLFICNELERVDGLSSFKEDQWTRPEGGGGFTNTIKNLGLEGNEFFATGVSIVLHPNNPHVPIIHMNVRYFELDSGEYWFGGGIDLTPHYVIPENAVVFHQRLKAICDQYNADFYKKFKNWADDYFYIPHRQETRGIGGIFYDHLDESVGISKQELLNFALDLGRNFPFIYEEQAQFGREKEITSDQLAWRNLRRGRYVEFNLVNDRGTKFGLLSGGRTESILMSLPPLANWEYNLEIEPDSLENKTLEYLKTHQNWLG